MIRGLGDLHLRIKLEKMTQQYKLELDDQAARASPTAKPSRRKADGHCRHKKQTGGAGQFGEVYLRIEPLRARRGLRVRRRGEGRRHPHASSSRRWKKACARRSTTASSAGYPVEDLRVIVYDGKSHAVDSKEIAFVSAGRKAVIDAIPKAAPIMLEPIVNIEIDGARSATSAT